MTNLVKESAAKLYGEITLANEMYYYTTTVINTTAGQEYIDFTAPTPGVDAPDPWGFLKLLGVDALINGQKRTLRRYDFRERNIYSDGTSLGWQSVNPRYFPRGATKIYLLPTPEAVYPVTVHYVPIFDWSGYGEGELRGDVFDGVNGWEEFIVLDAAIKCLTKDQALDPSLLIAERDRELQRIRNEVTQRDQGEPQYVVDMDSRLYEEDKLWAHLR